jgi:hypothetical protein
VTKREFIIARLPKHLSQQHRESYADEILKPGGYGNFAFELGVAWSDAAIAVDIDELEIVTPTTESETP